MRTTSQHVFEVLNDDKVRMFRQAASAAKYVATLNGEYRVTVMTDGKTESYYGAHVGQVASVEDRRKMAYSTMLQLRDNLNRS